MLFLAALPALDGGLNGSLPEILIAALALLACLPAALLRPAPDGVLTESRGDIIRSFCMQTGMNPDLKKPVGHIALSYSAVRAFP